MEILTKKFDEIWGSGPGTTPNREAMVKIQNYHSKAAVKTSARRAPLEFPEAWMDGNAEVEVQTG